MGRYSKAFSIKKQFQSPNCQTCQGQSRTLKKIVFLELFLRIIEEEKWNLFEKIGQLRTPSGGGGGDEERNPIYWLALPGALGISDYADHYYRHPELWNHQISRIDVHPAYKGRQAAKKYNKMFFVCEAYL